MNVRMFVEKRSELDIRHSVYKGPPFEFWWINGIKKIKGGTLVKCLIPSLSEQAQTLHSLAKLTSSQNLKSLTQ